MNIAGSEDELKKNMSKLGKIGGRARAEKLSPEYRRLIAQYAAHVRWHKK